LLPYRSLFLANTIGTYKENVDSLDIYRFYLLTKTSKHIRSENYWKLNQKLNQLWLK